MFVLAPLALYLRYQRADSLVRRQVKYPAVSIMLLLVLMLIFWVFPDPGNFDARYGYPITWSITMMFPVSIGIAILKHKLFDIDLILNRAIVYGILTALVVVSYIAIVSVLAFVVQSQTGVFNGLIATGIIAVIFQPGRERLQTIVRRIMYGERDDPAGILSQLAQHLETADTPSAILPNLVQTIASTLKIPYVAILIPRENDNMEVITEWGKAPEQREMISLVYQTRTIGYLMVAPRSPGERFTSNERILLNTIAALTATTLRSTELSDELRQSRQRIISAREEERRRIRRDLHDGLGPRLASQTLALEAISQQMQSNPEKAQAILESIQTQSQEAIQDVRRLVYDLRPPALDDLGLIGALKQSASRYETGQLQFKFDVAELPDDLPAAIETAIFRIAQEAMTNVVRHSCASHCLLRLYCDEDDIVIEIEDNGNGLPDSYVPGIGLQAMTERSAELNGETIIGALSGGGTQVRARFPLEAYRE